MGYKKSDKLIRAINRAAEITFNKTEFVAAEALNQTVHDEVYAKLPDNSTLDGWRRSGEFGRSGRAEYYDTSKKMEVFHDVELMGVIQHQSLAGETYGDDKREAIPAFIEKGVKSRFRSYKARPYQDLAALNVIEAIKHNMKQRLERKGVHIKGVK